VLDSGLIRVQWDAPNAETALVRGPGTRRVLAFLKGGSGEVQADGFELVVELSNGVTSTPFNVKAGMPSGAPAGTPGP